ncbi:LysR family transcriptional regulator [Devosia nitrariae]|uniref:LysR family transcriptional regulator n=1 Tax=Devosia nitrariae TaxID=2071872 RepID=A0ABQ5WBV0_9HYPH|nr:LysR family transcriptional regulator [Devosia nitrariae]GLQ57266.1 LysR family transcriptional regulator [Devosia nitrariae]
MDRLTSMAVFVKAADLGSFAAAAEALELSGPMVGKHVRHLEERLGVRLINRTTRRQSLTEFGRAYYERCRTVLAEAEAADALVGGQISAPVGKLRVTMPALIGRRCIAPILLPLAQRHKELELELSFGDRIVDLAEDGFDLAVRTGTLTGGAGLMTRRIGRHTMIVCAAPSHIAQHGRPRQLEDLERHKAIIYSRPGWTHAWLFPREGEEPARVSPPARLRLDDLEAIADAAEAGMGLAWLPSFLVRERLAVGTLVPLLTDHPGYVFDNHVLWLETPHLPAKIRLAIDALAAELPGVLA